MDPRLQIKEEYHCSYKIWPAFLAAGIVECHNQYRIVATHSIHALLMSRTDSLRNEVCARHRSDGFPC